MKTPLAVKLICNILFYILYWAFACFVVGIGYGVLVGDMSSAVALKVAIFLFFVVAVVTLVARKYFYMRMNTSEKEEHIGLQKIEKKGQKKYFQIEEEREEGTKEDDGLKIKIEKEIK